MTTLLVILCAYFDRLRGSEWRMFDPIYVGKHKIKGGDTRLMYGLILGSLFYVAAGEPLSWLVIPFAVLFAVGESFGWTEAIGGPLRREPMDAARLDDWQIGLVGDVNNGWLALMARGVMWGVPILPLAYWNPAFLWMPAIMMVAMVVAVFIAYYTPGSLSRQWAAQERLRGLIAGLLVVAYATVRPLLA